MTDRNEALRLADACKHGWLENVDPDKCGLEDLLALLRQQAERIAELEKEIADLHTTMFAAAVEIHEHWDAHCDAEGYGPANLMHRLERGIASQYGYDAKTLQRVEAERDQLKTDLHIATDDAAQMLASTQSLRSERDQLRAEVERLKREKANAIDKAGHMLAAGMGLSNCAFNLKQRVGETLSIRDVAALESSQRAWDAAIDAARTTHKETE